MSKNSTMKNLASVSKEEQKQFLSSFDHVLSDVDGVLWLQLHEIPGAIDGVRALRKAGKTLRFISNYSMIDVESYKAKLAATCQTENEELIIPTVAIIDYLKSRNFQKEAYVIGSPLFKEDLRKAGIKVAEDAPDRIEPNLGALMKNTQTNGDVGAVIANMDINLNYVKLQKALNYLKNPDVIFLKAASDLRAPASSTLIFIGPGYFHQPLEDLSGRKGHSLAKPSVEFNECIVKRFNIQDKSRVLFLGDSISEDMGFATNCGYKKLLFLTGLAKKEHIEDWDWPEELKPDYYVDCLKTFGEIIENCLN